MLKKYLPVLILGPISNLLWAFWALPEIGEQGNPAETLQWICVQAVLPLLFGIFLALGKKFIFWAMIVYSGFILLFGVGVFGWGLMGPATPFSVYLVAVILFVMGFSLLYQSLKDLNFGREVRHYDMER